MVVRLVKNGGVRTLTYGFYRGTRSCDEETAWVDSDGRDAISSYCNRSESQRAFASLFYTIITSGMLYTHTKIRNKRYRSNI